MSDILAEGRALAEKYHSEAGGGFINEGRKNAYECRSCNAYIVTIDRHPGVTPFLIQCGYCRAYEGQSKGYRVSQHLKPTHEWYRPDTLDGIEPAYFDHIGKGGLILRAMPSLPDKWNQPDAKLSETDILAEQMEMKRMMDRLIADERKAVFAETTTRQQRRQKERKGEPPAEIQMYGVTYRRVP